MKISYVFQGIAFTTAIASMILGIVNSGDWLWQFNCAVWVAIAFSYEALNQKLTKRIKSLTQDLMKQIKKEGGYE